MSAEPPIRLQWYRFAEMPSGVLYEVLALRQEVFVVEQHCAYLDADGRDQHSWHLVATNDRGECVAYLRLIPPGYRFSEPSIGRVVTRPRSRNRGIGTILVREGIRKSQEIFAGMAIRISAQHYLQQYYRGLGFVTEGEGNPYEEDGIPHVEMIFPPSPTVPS